MGDEQPIQNAVPDEDPAVQAVPTAAAADASPAQPAAEAEAPSEDPKLAPIIVKKIIDEGHGGAHGGAWKIALADMMTAMMAFFLLMWLLGASNTDQRKSIADYFKPTTTTKSSLTINETSGSQGLLGGQSIIDEQALPQTSQQTALLQMLVPRDATGSREIEKEGPKDPAEEEKRRIANELDQANFDKIQQELSDHILKDKDLSKLRDQVNFVREREGLRIEVIDKADFSMFGLGTSTLAPRAQALIGEIARSIGPMPNRIKVRGHTDSIPYNAPDRNNWSLSAERAEVTRQVISARGVDPKRFARIEGVADTEPFNAADPLDPRNRRISITLMYRES